MEELSKHWQKADKEYSDWREKVGIFLGSVEEAVKVLPTKIKKFEFLKKLDLDSGEINGLLEDEGSLFFRKEKNFNSNLKKLRDLQRNGYVAYYSGNLSSLS